MYKEYGINFALQIKINNKKGETMSIPKPSNCMSIDDLSIGMKAEKLYTISHEDAVNFSKLSGDWNPAHHDEEYAAASIFKQRVTHGMFSVIQFSGILGMDLPGLGTLWLKQSVEFLRPGFSIMNTAPWWKLLPLIKKTIPLLLALSALIKKAINSFKGKRLLSRFLQTKQASQ